MDSLLYAMFLIALFCTAVGWWWRLGHWCWMHGKEVKQKAGRLMNAAVSAYKEK